MDAEEAFRLELTIEAPTDRVLEAITTRQGISEWWTEGTTGSARQGGTLRFVFSSAGWTEMRVDRVEPGLVEWTCTGQDMSGFEPRDEWVGTRVVFELAEAGEGRTVLRFAHHGLPALPCLEMCERGWNEHVGTSLKALAETGSGMPV